MPRKTRPYLFYDTTTSVCATCLHVVEAKIVMRGERVYMDKWCPVHGTERVLVSDDVAYYRACRETWIKPPELPNRFATTMTYGCPYDCGLCPDHMQHSCLSLVEINEHCNLECPICYAESGPRRSLHRSLDEVRAMLDAIVASEGEADVVQISGGEPTLHPQLFEILAEAAARPIRHLMLNTNGLRIAKDAPFVERLAREHPKLEVYLQFDSLRPAALKRLRGATLQRIQEAGRTHGYDRHENRLTVSEIRRRIAEQSELFTAADVVPVPCNPDTLAMAYALKLGGEVVPLTRYVDAATLVAGERSTIVFEHDPA